MEEEDIDMETVHDSQAFIHHQLNLLERPSTPGTLFNVKSKSLIRDFLHTGTSFLETCFISLNIHKNPALIWTTINEFSMDRLLPVLQTECS